MVLLSFDLDNYIDRIESVWTRSFRKVKSELMHHQELGLTGTPTVFVDGLKVGNYLDLASYERLMRLSDAMAAAEGSGAEE